MSICYAKVTLRRTVDVLAALPSAWPILARANTEFSRALEVGPLVHLHTQSRGSSAEGVREH